MGRFQKKNGNGSDRSEQGTSANGDRTRSGLQGLTRGNLVAFRSAAVFLTLSGLFYGLLHRPGSDHLLLNWHLTNLTGEAARVLSFLGYNTEADGRWLRTSRFDVEIARGCDAIEPLGLFIASVMAIPLRPRWRKIAGLVVGCVILLIVNMTRIVSLVIIGTHWPRVFREAHEQIWQAAFIILVFVMWAGWVQWASRPRTRASAPCL